MKYLILIISLTLIFSNCRKEVSFEKRILKIYSDNMIQKEKQFYVTNLDDKKYELENVFKLKMVVDSAQNFNEGKEKYFIHFTYNNQYVLSRCCGMALPSVVTYNKLTDKFVEIVCDNAIFNDTQFDEY